MTQRFTKWQKILEMAQIHGARLKYFKNGFTMLEMAQKLTNGLNKWEMTNVCGKWLKYLRNV